MCVIERDKDWDVNWHKDINGEDNRKNEERGRKKKHLRLLMTCFNSSKSRDDDRKRLLFKKQCNLDENKQSESEREIRCVKAKSQHSSVYVCVCVS